MQTYIMKLARSGEDGEKVHVVLESGVRFHTTQVGIVNAHLPDFSGSRVDKELSVGFPVCSEHPGLLASSCCCMPAASTVSVM